MTRNPLSQSTRYLIRLMYDNGSRLRYRDGRWWVNVGSPHNEFHEQWVRQARRDKLVAQVESSEPGERHFLLTDAGCRMGLAIQGEEFAAIGPRVLGEKP